LPFKLTQQLLWQRTIEVIRHHKLSRRQAKRPGSDTRWCDRPQFRDGTSSTSDHNLFSRSDAVENRNHIVNQFLLADGAHEGRASLERSLHSSDDTKNGTKIVSDRCTVP